MTAPLTPERLAEMRARVEVATDGPWVRRGWAADWEDEVLSPNGVIADTGTCENAEFIAHARTDVPDLLAALDAATERAERAEAALARVEVVAKEQEMPFCDGTPDREGEAVAAAIREAMEGKP